ncbi:imidazole glycerol phosphate synthase subunit HisH [Candidatus Sumerlaeota bacterium]|nr:imidazole glycerol phosphate synthase subunit HisH [Candidatus Sumerlaeota bacterium]
MIVIVDYNAGNLRSVKRACDAVGVESTISPDPETVVRAERIVFPGVGAAPSAMETLRRTGLDRALREAFDKGTPILGICLGTQIVLDASEEGDQTCLGLIEGKTVRFDLQDPLLKIPHIGWNAVEIVRPHPLLEGTESGDDFYFVHSYYPSPESSSDVYAVTEYETPFCSALGRRNLFATQFHPEKSGRFGLRILERFARWDGSAGD